MDPDAMTAFAREALWLMVSVSLPPLVAGSLTGLASALLQSITQIQEPTLSVVPRLAAAVLSLVVTGPWIAHRLLLFAAAALEVLPEVGR